MTKATAPERHRQHDTSLPATVALLLVLPVLGCGGGLPRPTLAQVVTGDYVAVAFPPRPPPIEYVPPRPPGRKGAVWIDGSWEWQNGRFVWRFGTWLVPPSGLRRTEWVVVRRAEDGQLFFAPSAWKDEHGATVDDRTFRNALGGAARARTRVGGPGADPLDAANGLDRGDMVTTQDTEE